MARRPRPGRVHAGRPARRARAGGRALTSGTRAAGALPIGRLLDAPAEAAELTAPRFNRHTFWCGQSGSGKTYALGVVLEQLLARTELPIVVFDPNADFVRLAEVRPEAEGTETAAMLGDRDIRVLRPGGKGTPLRARFTALSLPAKAAVLRLDPLVDRAEYNSLLHAGEVISGSDERGIVEQLRSSDDASRRALAERIENLAVTQWELWAGQDRAAPEIIAERPDATVLDLGGFAHAEEPLVIALAVLEDLWARREERRPVLLVIDEAHNLCSPDLEGPLAVAVREQLIRIAAEGRKYGLWLLLSTQRPSKIHPGILSQCDNLALMKMSSPLDLAELGSVFGFAPAELLAQSPHFTQGTALFAGGFVPSARLVTMGERVTPEGGVDVRIPLRAPR